MLGHRGGVSGEEDLSDVIWKVLLKGGFGHVNKDDPSGRFPLWMVLLNRFTYQGQ